MPLLPYPPRKLFIWNDYQQNYGFETLLIAIIIWKWICSRVLLKGSRSERQNQSAKNIKIIAPKYFIWRWCCTYISMIFDQTHLTVTLVKLKLLCKAVSSTIPYQDTRIPRFRNQDTKIAILKTALLQNKYYSLF